MEVKQWSKGFQKIFLYFIFIPFLLLCLSSSSLAQGVQVFENLGIYGGKILDIAIDASNPDKMFASSYMGDGLFLTTNGGNNWQAVETKHEYGFKNSMICAVKIAPGDPDIIWVTASYSLEKSADGGQNWTHIYHDDIQKICTNCGGDTDDGRFLMSLAIDPSDSQTVYVGSGGPDNTYSTGAVYKTTDGGTTWTKMNQGNDFDYAVVDIDIDPQDNNIIWIVTNSQGIGGWGGTLYRSENGGDTWSGIYIMTPNSAFLAIAVKPNDSNTVFTGSGFGIIKHYFDEGQWKYSWPVIDESRLAQDISFDPQDAEVLYTTWLRPVSWGGDGIGKVARSTDGGNTWDIYPHDYNYESLAIHPTKSEIIIAGEFKEGIFRSEDHGQTWNPVNNGVNAVIVYDVAIDPNSSNHILAATFAGFYEKKDSGNWLQLIRDSSRSVQFHPTNSQIFFAGMEGYLAKTLDGGQNWTYSNMLDNGYNYVSDIAIDPTNTDTIFIAVAGFENYGKVFKSENEGDTFDEVLDGENQSSEKYDFNVVAIDPANNLHIFAGGGNFYMPFVLGDLWESTDGGDNWSRTTLQNVIVNALLIHPQNSNIMYAGTGYSGYIKNKPLFKSTDKGATWRESYTGIPRGEDHPYNAVTALEFHPQNINIIYASTYGEGIYISNQGKSWINLGIPDYDVYAIATSSLYTATQGGLLQLTGTGVIAGKVTDAISVGGIDGATVCTDTGAMSVSIEGDYIMKSSPAICSVTAIAHGYDNHTEKYMEVMGGEVTFVDFSMQRGISDITACAGQNIENTSAGSKYCFIATAAYGSSMSKQVKILRIFRDKYLLPYTTGEKLINFYYRSGKQIAVFIESNPWLKFPVRLSLYPMVAFAWLMISTSAISKILISLIVLIGIVFMVEKIKSSPKKFKDTRGLVVKDV